MLMVEETFKRLYPRRRFVVPCRLLWEDQHTSGMTVDISYAGVGALIFVAAELEATDALLHLPEDIVLRVCPVHRQQRTEGRRVGFKVMAVERGEAQWKHLCYVPYW